MNKTLRFIAAGLLFDLNLYLIAWAVDSIFKLGWMSPAFGSSFLDVIWLIILTFTTLKSDADVIRKWFNE